MIDTTNKARHFCIFDFDLGGHFKGHLGKNVGFIAYSYIIIVNNLKTVMISKKVYILWLIELIKLDFFCFYDFDLRGHLKVIWAKMLVL